MQLFYLALTMHVTFNPRKALPCRLARLWELWRGHGELSKHAGTYQTASTQDPGYNKIVQYSSPVLQSSSPIPDGPYIWYCRLLSPSPPQLY